MIAFLSHTMPLNEAAFPGRGLSTVGFMVESIGPILGRGKTEMPLPSLPRILRGRVGCRHRPNLVVHVEAMAPGEVVGLDGPGSTASASNTSVSHYSARIR